MSAPRWIVSRMTRTASLLGNWETIIWMLTWISGGRLTSISHRITKTSKLKSTWLFTLQKTFHLDYRKKRRSKSKSIRWQVWLIGKRYLMKQRILRIARCLPPSIGTSSWKRSCKIQMWQKMQSKRPAVLSFWKIQQMITWRDSIA